MATFDLGPVADRIESRGWRQGRGNGTVRDGLTVKGAVRLEYRNNAPAILAVLRHRGVLDEDWNDQPRVEADVLAAVRAEPVIDDGELSAVLGSRTTEILQIVRRSGRLPIGDVRAMTDALDAEGWNNATMVAQESDAETRMINADAANADRIAATRRAVNEAFRECELDAHLDRNREAEEGYWNVDWTPAFARAERAAKRAAISYVQPSALTPAIRQNLRRAWETVVP